MATAQSRMYMQYGPIVDFSICFAGLSSAEVTAAGFNIDIRRTSRRPRAMFRRQIDLPLNTDVRQ